MTNSQSNIYKDFLNIEKYLRFFFYFYTVLGGQRGEEMSAEEGSWSDRKGRRQEVMC